LATSETFFSYRLLTVDYDQDPSNVFDSFFTTGQTTPDIAESFTLLLSRNKEDNTITYLVAVLEGVIA